MIIGIDDYQSTTDLRGAVNDASKIYRLITSDEKKGFPKENVCLLTNADATYANIKEKFESALVNRAAPETGKKADQILFYYAGHGSQVVDENGDEDTDGLDETLFLHDSLSRVSGNARARIPQLTDDEFNQMLGRLKEKSPNFTVILDSCHSGSATRDTNARTRFVPPDQKTLARAEKALVEGTITGEGSPNFAEFTPFSFPKAVFMSAARDREAAIERAGEGEFTRALVNVLRKRDGARITYDQLFARVKSEMGVSAGQVPVLSGASGNFVFTKDIPYAPSYDWTVLQKIPNGVQISGIPTSDIGEGAEFLILPGSMTAEEAQDPNIAKARMKAVSSPSGNIWNLELIKDFERGAIEVGDFANLVLPSPNARKLRVRIRPANEPNGIVNAAMLRATLEETKEEALSTLDSPRLEFVNENHEFEIALNDHGKIALFDAQGRTRNIYNTSDVTSQRFIDTVNFDLANHLRQITLLTGWKIEGGSMIANETLKVWLEPVPASNFNNSTLCKSDYRVGKWRKHEKNEPHDVPLCALYKVMVELAEDAPVPVNVAGSVLSANGRMDYLPRWSDNERRPVELAKGEKAELAIFQATPDSLQFEEHVYILGLPAVPTGGQPVAPIPWRLLSTDRTKAPFFAARTEKEYGAYTILPIRTIANADFAELSSDGITKETATREYTIKKFDISPYLPDAKETSALYRVLKAAQELTEYNKSENGETIDGVSYKQHAWCEGSTNKNLAKGIDCSRSIWYAFTRAGLPYNRHAQSIPDEAQCVSPYDPTKDGYLYTGDMARKSYLMSDNFEDCLTPDENGKRAFQLGDVLVYRDKEKGDGHTVMVIDPEKRIAWGSHGWDGNPRLQDPVTGSQLTADLGVEFQKIKIKTDWERWDRSTMELKACWRHNAFVEERRTPTGRPGLAAVCESALRTDTPYFRTSICSELVSAVN
ncbi:Metacaspase-1A [Durusdinium trenchii]|uniref:Metacaspase-1A n=1 Tax=Durusdinium trenchii TaxID=1381693 RepID=A0ABP0IQC3_9DINO